MKKKYRYSKMERKERMTSLLFASPMIIKTIVFTVCCLIFAVYFSFTDYNIMNDAINFVKWENYKTLFNDIIFQKACLNTLYLMISIPISMTLGFCLAYVLNKHIPGTSFYRVVYYLPAVSSALAIGIVWKWILNDEFGVLNSLLGTKIGWLTDPAVVKNSLIMKNVWGGMGSSMLLQLAAMQNIDKTYYEAADLDGANEFVKIFHITLPLLSPIVFYMLTVNIIGGLNAFTDNYIVVSSDATNTVVYYMYQKITIYGKYAEACAASVMLGIVVFFMSLIQFKFSKKWVLEE